MNKLFCLFLSAAVMSLQGQMTLVENGKARTAIVIPDRPQPCHELAAEELVHHVRKASGAVLEVFRESEAPTGFAGLIYLGNCQASVNAGIAVSAMKPSHFAVRISGRDLFINGKDRMVRGGVGSAWFANWQGTLYGVYDFLREELGVRWIFPGDLGEVVPRKSTLTISGTDRSGGPKLLYTDLVEVGRRFPYSHMNAWSGPAAAERYMNAQRRFLLRHGFGSVENMNYTHNFSDYWRRFGKSRPEFFAMVNPGVRSLLKGDGVRGAQTPLCLSNPTLHKQVVDDFEARAPAVSAVRPFLSVCLNDTPEMCICPECRAWDAPDPAFESSDYWGKGKVLTYRERWSLSTAAWGELNSSGLHQPSLSDRYAKFCLAVQREAEKEDPKVTLIGFAYSNYVNPPKMTKLNSRIIMMNVFGLWFPYTKEMSENFRANWNGWKDAGVKQVYRPNLLHAGANLPIFYARQFAADFNFAYRNGMIASYMDSLIGAFSTQGSTLYTIVRMHWNPELTADGILEEYYSAFGSASKEVRAYFEFWEKHSGRITSAMNERFREENKWNGWRGGMFLNYALIAHEICPPDALAEGFRLLEKAEKAAQGHPDDLARVRYLGKGLKDAEFTVRMRLAQIARQKHPGEHAFLEYRKAFQKLIRHRRLIENDCVGNIGVWAYREHSGCNWPWKINSNQGEQ